MWLRRMEAETQRRYVETRGAGRSARQLRLLLWLAMGLCIPLGIAWGWYLGPSAALAYSLSLIGWAAALAVLHRTEDHVLAGRLGCAVLFGLCAANIVALGGLHSNALGWLSAVPLAGAVIVGVRDSLVWAVLGCTTAILLYAAHGGACGLPAEDALALSNAVTGISVVAVLCFAWGRLQRATEAELDTLLRIERTESATATLLLELSTIASRDLSLEDLSKQILKAIVENLSLARAEIELSSNDPGEPILFAFPDANAPRMADFAGAEFPISWSDDVLGTLRVSFLAEVSSAADADRVLRSVAAQLGHAATRVRTRDSLRRAAELDELTGLPNRRAFRMLLESTLGNCREHDRVCAVLYIDLNGFKRINDGMGHAGGDQLLCEVARRLSRAIRHSDSACRGYSSGLSRLGGDEFSVILDEIEDPKNAEIVAQRILQQLAKPFDVAGREVFVGASIGIAIYPTDAEDIEGVITSADAAMYAAKARGKAGFLRFSPHMQEPDPISLEADLHRAVAQGELEVHFQPILCGVSGRVTGAEALLRWTHKERGAVSPAEFIPICERTGLIEDVGEFTLETSLAWLSENRDRLGPDFRLSLNISPKQLENVAFIHELARRLSASSVATRSIEFEITETVLMADSEELWEHIRALAGLGVGFALDDFGTGYSSLSLVKRMPISRLKIDRSFVRGLPDDAEDVAIVSAILGMADSLDVPVVAEGVETEAHQEFLSARGCAELQGWLFAKAMPGDALIQWITSREKA